MCQSGLFRGLPTANGAIDESCFLVLARYEVDLKIPTQIEMSTVHEKETELIRDIL